MIRGRSPYYPRWGDDKHRQAIASASLCWFGEDLSDEILREIQARQQRVGSPWRPGQPWPNADHKVWRRIARERDNRELLDHLRLVAKARKGR